MNVPITQSGEWQNLQNDLKTDSFLVSGDDFSYLAIKKTTPVGNYLYCPYGPVVKTESSLNNAIESLYDLSKKHHAIFLRIEPQWAEAGKHLNPVVKSLNLKLKKTKDLNPKETWVLSLTGTDEELRERLPSRLLRYYKARSKNGISIEKSHNIDDIKHLLKLQHALAKKKGISTFSENYLKTELAQPFATLYLVKHTDDETAKSEIVAAGLVFDDKTTRYNLQGAQSEQGRALHATGILTIELIMDAKANGQEFFDFWGIAPEGAPSTHPWAGFTSFKKTFAGQEVDYAGTYDIIINPTKYKLYTTLRKVRRLV